jgi:hypothetical protein
MTDNGILPYTRMKWTGTVQKRQRVRLVHHMQRKSILYVTDNLSIASFLADFYALSASASMEYIEYAGILQYFRH